MRDVCQCAALRPRIRDQPLPPIGPNLVMSALIGQRQHSSKLQGGCFQLLPSVTIHQQCALGRHGTMLNIGNQGPEPQSPVQRIHTLTFKETCV